MISREYHHFEEISHLISQTIGLDTYIREVIDSFSNNGFRTVIKHTDKFVVLKSMMDGRLAGTVTVRIRPSEYYIMYLAVAKPFRKRGIARSLINYIMTSFPHRKFKLSCEEGLISMYKKFDFREVGRSMAGLVYMERGPMNYPIENPCIYDIDHSDEDTWEKSDIIISNFECAVRHMYGLSNNGREVIFNHLPNTHRVLNKASLSSLDLDFYPETRFYGRYSTIHSEMEYRIMKPVDKFAQMGIALLQPGAKTNTIGNCVVQKLIPPMLDSNGYKWDIVTKIYVSAAGAFWIPDETVTRRCHEPYNVNHLNLSNVIRISKKETRKISPDTNLSDDILHVARRVFTKVHEKLFGDVYSGFQVLDLTVIYDNNGKMWLMDFSNTINPDESLVNIALEARLRNNYERLIKI